MPSEVRQRTFLGHPLGLYVLFFTEMWERFSYYGMRALLMLYMVNYFKWTQQDASAIYKWYTSLVYLTPLIGGYLADRYLGNKWAVVIGAILMGAGEFLLTIPNDLIFYSALVFLIVGNGFFKPNMSAQVGRLYPPRDPRRDGAYTIFYMGINLGAFLSPLVCGWLANNTIGTYRTGFMAAGIGMVLGLGCYMFGLPLIVEIDDKQTPETPPTDALTPVAEEAGAEPRPHHTQAAAIPPDQMPSVVPIMNKVAPLFFHLAAVSLALASVPVLILRGVAANQKAADAWWAFPGFLATNTLIGLVIVAVCAAVSAWIIGQVKNAERDRVLSIYVLGIFVVFFWAAFEQAGNALNLWADKSTDRFLTTNAPEPPLFPEVVESEGGGDGGDANVGGEWLSMWKLKPSKGGKEEEGGWSKLFNPVATEWFQSINALAIFLLAPIFAALWVRLAKYNANPSTPAKMAIGVLLMSASFGVMVFSAKKENQPSKVQLEAGLPASVLVNGHGQVCAPASKDEPTKPGEPFQAGRLTYDKDSKTLHMMGVLSDLDRDRVVQDTAPKEFVEAIKEFKKKTDDAKGDKFEESIVLEPAPDGFDIRYAGISPKKLRYDPATKKLTAVDFKLADKDIAGLKVAGADKDFRSAIDRLYVGSAKFKVSSWWLFWCYILATLGELCLSPVGLSMVSKLAPARFATMLMGLWLLTSFFGNFAAGAFGESWGTMDPAQYFMIPVIALGIAALVLIVLVRKVVGMMHGVD